MLLVGGIVGFDYLWDLPGCMCGDFNITRFTSECLGDTSTSSDMEEFSEFIFVLDLLDLPLVGGTFTWSNSRSWSRLDRFIVSPSWALHFLELYQKRMFRVCSNHFPILLDCGGIHGV
ncbi:hypothetical protein I3760_02G035900 [Carya illinoinensis]|nr:hypothetical protein I3760_02G035900 [Carya illinoinensis]